MDVLLLLIFVIVYAGMLLGEFPGLALDRTGVALLGAIALVATGRLSPHDAWQSIDVSTIGLLFGLMVVSAQLRLGGFYSRFTARLAAFDVSPPFLLLMVVISAGVLSALLCNDIICLAMAPVLAEGCARRKLNPVPFLLALAAAANVGSAATLIGNPQNMLIGQVLQLSFARYLWQALPPSLVGLVCVWLVIAISSRGKWQSELPPPKTVRHPFKIWQTTKGFMALGVLIAAFLMTNIPREILALSAAGVLLTSRRMATHEMLEQVDWHLLVLFAGLFVVNHAMSASGNLDSILSLVRKTGIEPSQPTWLFALSVSLSNLVSNVPATMLLLPVAKHSLAGPILALSSTFAGNLLVVGSIANIIVVDQAREMGIRISWTDHAKVGIPITLLTLAVAGGWLAYLAGAI